MSTPPEGKPKTTTDRLTELETNVTALQKDADQTAKTLEHAQVLLKPEAIGAAVAASIVAGGITLLAPAFNVFKAELPTVKDFTPQIHDYVERKFGWVSAELKAERAMERRLTGIENALDLSNSKIVSLRNRMTAVETVASRADRLSRDNSTTLNRRGSAVQAIGGRNPVDARQAQNTREVATEVRRLEFHINQLVTALSS